MSDNLHRERLRTAESGGGAGSATAISATNERAVVKSRLRRVLAAIVAPADNHCNHVHDKLGRCVLDYGHADQHLYIEEARVIRQELVKHQTVMAAPVIGTADIEKEELRTHLALAYGALALCIDKLPDFIPIPESGVSAVTFEVDPATPGQISVRKGGVEVSRIVGLREGNKMKSGTASAFGVLS